MANSLQLVRRGLPMITSSQKNEYASVGKWLFGTAGLVVGMIHVGGVTRLTRSGLSMTSWSPLGTLPPLSKEEWEKEFERYKTFPEWQQRKSMSMNEFKFIYGWEYGHRMLGRFVGVCFCVPWIYFTARGKIPKGYQMRCLGLLAMGGGQGLVGWWMVKSGLGDDRMGDKQEIRVKPVRLTAHLSMALATYGALVWTGMDILGIKHSKNIAQVVGAQLGRDGIRLAQRLRTGSIQLTLLTAITVGSGGLVAGLDAGLAYNTFPKMDEEWIPSEINDLSPWYRNFYENTATVQFNHRVLGSATAATALYLSALGLSRNYRKLLTPQARKGMYAIGVTATAQVVLGITTLLNYVPISLAAAHQVGSIVVFTSSLYLAHSLRYVAPKILKEACRAVKHV